MFLYTSGSTGRPKGVVLSHYSHLWAISQRVRRPVPQGQRSLVAAPLYHMNGLAMCQTTLNQGDTIVLLPQFTTKGYIEAAARHRVHVPHLGADHDRHDAAREGASGQQRPLGGRGGAHGLRADHPVADRPGARASSRRPRSATATARPRPGPSCSARIPDGIPQPELSTGYPHPEVQLRLVRDGKEVQGMTPRGRARDEVRRADDALSQAARGHGQGDDAGRLLPHRRRVPPRRQRLLLLRRPRRRHVRVRRREHLSRRGREDAGAPSRHPSGRRHPDPRRAEGPQADRLRRARRRRRRSTSRR